VLTQGEQPMLKPLFFIAFIVLSSGLFIIALNYRPSKILTILRRTRLYRKLGQRTEKVYFF
jgi:hypothetical protein